MKKTLLFCLCHCLLSAASAQLQPGQIDAAKVPGPSAHFQAEYTFDTSVDPARWSNQQSGMHVSFGSTDQSYFRSEVPDIEKETLSWEETGWRGERLNATLMVWSSDTLEQVRFKLNDLVNAKGQVLSKRNIQPQLVRYVLSNYPYGAKDATCDVAPSDKAYLLPDRLETFERFDLPGRTVRPVWLSLEIPAETEPGVYNGTIEVLAEKYTSVLQLKVIVQNQLLPPPHDWKHRLDLWQNPWVVAWYYQIEPWSEAHTSLLKKHLKLYADAGGKYITTYAVHSPWSDNSYMIEGTMVEWIKCKDGSWKFDYRIFDQYVQLAMEMGIDKAITIYTPVPWEHRFRYVDEQTGNYVYESWAPGSDKFKAFWHIFLSDLKAHLSKKGWLEKTYLGINENPLEHTMAAIGVIKAHSKDWRITYAGDWHPELDQLLDDYSPVLNKEPDLNQVKARAARGFTTTYYVCCTPPKPNTFVFSPPVEGRYISWYTAAYGYDGFLRWAYDAWPADPVRDARHTLWPAGDCFLIYPGGNSSIRFEKLREGIVDYEKIRILRELSANSPDKKNKKLIKEFENHLKTFVSDREYNEEKIRNSVHTGKKMLDRLSDAIAR